jgi:hypothetical protein
LIVDFESHSVKVKNKSINLTFDVPLDL